jgi:hypothetical protein
MLLLYAIASGCVIGAALIVALSRHSVHVVIQPNISKKVDDPGFPTLVEDAPSRAASHAGPVERPAPMRESTKALNRILTGSDDPAESANKLGLTRARMEGGVSEPRNADAWPAHKSVRVGLDVCVLVTLVTLILIVSVSDYSIDVGATLSSSFPVEHRATLAARSHLAFVASHVRSVTEYALSTCRELLWAAKDALGL